MKAYSVAVKVLSECEDAINKDIPTPELKTLVDSLDYLFMLFGSDKEIKIFCSEVQRVIVLAHSKGFLATAETNKMYSDTYQASERALNHLNKAIEASGLIINMYENPNITVRDIFDNYSINTLKIIFDFPEKIKELFYSDSAKAKLINYVSKLAECNPERVSYVTDFLGWAHIIPEKIASVLKYYASQNMWSEFMSALKSAQFNAIDMKTSLFGGD